MYVCSCSLLNYLQSDTDQLCFPWEFFFRLQINRLYVRKLTTLSLCSPTRSHSAGKKRALCPRPAPLARCWCSPIATARGWAGGLPADCISISEYQRVKREVYHGSAMISAALLSVSWQLTCPSPQAWWQPSSWGNCLPAVRAAARSPFPASVFPQGDHGVGNQATSSEEVLEASQNNISTCLPRQIYFFPSLPPARNLRIAVTDLSSHFEKVRDFVHSQKLYIFHRLLQPAPMIISSSVLALPADRTQILWTGLDLTVLNRCSLLMGLMPYPANWFLPVRTGLSHWTWRLQHSTVWKDDLAQGSGMHRANKVHQSKSVQNPTTCIHQRLLQFPILSPDPHPLMRANRPEDFLKVERKRQQLLQREYLKQPGSVNFGGK